MLRAVNDTPIDKNEIETPYVKKKTIIVINRCSWGKNNKIKFSHHPIFFVDPE
jgi:hypothetical protein